MTLWKDTVHDVNHPEGVTTWLCLCGLACTGRHQPGVRTVHSVPYVSHVPAVINHGSVRYTYVPSTSRSLEIKLRITFSSAGCMDGSREVKNLGGICWRVPWTAVVRRMSGTNNKRKPGTKKKSYRVKDPCLKTRASTRH